MYADSPLIACNLRTCRLALCLTQEQLAKQADVSLSQLRLLEKGLGNPTLDTLQRLCDALGISLAELLQPPDEQRQLPPAHELEVRRLTRLMSALPEDCQRELFEQFYHQASMCIKWREQK